MSEAHVYQHRKKIDRDPETPCVTVNPLTIAIATFHEGEWMNLFMSVSKMIYILESNLFNEVSHQYLQLTQDAKRK